MSLPVFLEAIAKFIFISQYVNSNILIAIGRDDHTLVSSTGSLGRDGIKVI